MWRFLRHPNVLPLIGVMISKNQFAMVSDWMENGNINAYIEANPNVNRFKLVGHPSNPLTLFASMTIKPFQAVRSC